MRLPDFKLERYFAQHEFNVPYLLCCSDCESLNIGELLELESPEAYKDFLPLGLGYTESQGHPRLREEISRLYENIDPNQVLVTSGAEEGIFIFMNTLLNSEDHVIVQFPCYQSLLELPRAIGCQVTCWPMQENKGWSPDLNSWKTTSREIPGPSSSIPPTTLRDI